MQSIYTSAVLLFVLAAVANAQNSRAATASSYLERGNVWMAVRDSISIYDANGQHLGLIRTPEGPSNCCFGEGFRNLYVTARTSVYQVPTKVPGTRTF